MIAESNKLQAIIPFDISTHKMCDFLGEHYGEYFASDGFNGTSVNTIELGRWDNIDDDEIVTAFTHTVGTNQLGRHIFKNHHVGLEAEYSPIALEIMTSIIKEFGGYMLVDDELIFLGDNMTEAEFNNIQYVGVCSRRYWRFGIARKRPLNNYGDEIEMFCPGEIPTISTVEVDEYLHFIDDERIDMSFIDMKFPPLNLIIIDRDTGKQKYLGE